MSKANEFPGSIEYDEIYSDQVGVLFGHANTVTIYGTENICSKTLYLAPFDVYLLGKSRIEQLKKGFSYSIAGTDVGVILHGPLGHSADNENDRRPIERFDLECKYSAGELVVLVEGKTEEGTSGFEQFRDHALNPWKFKVQFNVPRAEMKRFFGIVDDDANPFSFAKRFGE